MPLFPEAPADARSEEVRIGSGDHGTLPVQWADFPKNLVVVNLEFYILGA